MKKLYRKGTVHPSPPVISDQLSFLPATIFTLTVALSPEDREVLAYLLSCSSNTTAPSSPFIISGNARSKTYNRNGVTAKAFAAGGGSGGSGVEVCGDHPPLFHCNCFRCYMSYWVRWDSSPNRQLIHEIIDAFEDWLAQNSNKLGGGVRNSRRERRNKRVSKNKEAQQLKGSDFVSSVKKEDFGGSESKGESSSGDDTASVEDEEKGSVRRFVDFIGERIWGVWG